MKTSIWITLLFMLLLEIITSDSSSIQTTLLNSGLFFEQIKEVRFTQTQYKIASLLFLGDFIHGKPNLQDLKIFAVLTRCTQIFRDEDICNQIIYIEEFEYAEFEVEQYLTELLDNLKPLDIRTRQPIETFTIQERIRLDAYSKQVKTFNFQRINSTNSYKNKTLLLTDNTQYIDSHPYDTFLEIKEKIINCTQTSELLINNKSPSSKYYTLTSYVRGLPLWTKQVRSLYTNYLNNLKEITTGIQLGRAGQLYAGILSPGKFITIETKFLLY